MPSFESDDYQELIGDQLVTLGKKKRDMLQEGPIELTIDGSKVKFPRVKTIYDPDGRAIPEGWTTIYDAVQQHYVVERNEKNPIPILCHREHMTPVAVCRVCMVNAKTQRGSKLTPACRRRIEPGMEVQTSRTNPDAILPTVKTIVELLLSDYHPPRGENLAFGESGENELETIARDLGIVQSKNRFPRGTPNRPRDDSSLLISVDHNACILCDRCIRGCNDIRKNFVLGRMGKGYNARIAFDLDEPMGGSSCVTCGECMVSCPTGALSGRAVVGDSFPPEVLTSARAVDPEELASHPMFQGISQPFLRWNRKAVVRRTFKKGEVICREGEYGSSAFIMEEGRFEVRIKSPLKSVAKQQSGIFSLFSRFAVGFGEKPGDVPAEGGDKFIPVDAPVALAHGRPVAIMEPKDILFGEMTCMNHYPRSATITAMEDCTVLEILRNVLYMLQRNEVSKKTLDAVYRERTLDNYLRVAPLFSVLTQDTKEFAKFVAEIRPCVKLIRVHPGQVIFRQGDQADHFYLVRSGFVKVSQNRQGGDRVMNYLGPGSYFGEIGLLSRLAATVGTIGSGLRTATCSALDHVDLVRLPGDKFLELLGLHPSLQSRLIEVAKERLRRDEEQWSKIRNESLGNFLSQGLENAGNMLVLDLERCTRCDECTKACADSHNGVTRLIREGLRFDRFLIATSCRSCLDPVCLVGCPTAAIQRTESGDINIKDSCIGCGKCAENCPYGNINMVAVPSGEKAPDPYNADRMLAVVEYKATTCDKCNGVETPSCVFACPHEAASRVDGKELLEWVRQLNAAGKTK